MTFSDIATMLGAGGGILVLLTVAAAPLLADLGPVRRRPAAPAVPSVPVPSVPAPPVPAPPVPAPPVPAPPAHVGVPVPRPPSPAEGVRGMLTEHARASAHHATAG